ncbi:MAG TPA: polymer-forming cytoskeletal protein [Anaerolineaceae bacterium]|nr:polymer-forming cytoskeletal protein [Anaerolineaceae bacterium]
MKNKSFSLWLRAGLVLSLAFGLVLTSVGSAQAADINGSGTVAKGETINDDLLLGGNTVTMDGTVNGMLLAGGNTVTIDGTVNGDAILAGKTIVISQSAVIDGNLFAAGSTIEVMGKITGSIASGSGSLSLAPGASVGRNIYYGGYNLDTQKETTIGKDLFFGGYQVILNGQIGQDVHLAGGAAEINGSIGRNAILDISAPEQQNYTPMFMPQQQLPPAIPSGLRISKDAQIGGKLIYTSSVNQNSAVQAVPAGGIVYQTPVPQQNQSPQNRPLQQRSPILGWLISQVRELISLLILGALALWLLPSIFERTVAMARTKVGESAGYGFVTLVVGYAGAFIVFIAILVISILLGIFTLGGLGWTFFGVTGSALGLALAIFTLLVTYGSKLIVAYLVGSWIVNSLFPQATHVPVWSMLLGVAVYVFLSSIPVLGFLIAFVVIIIGLGAIWLTFRSQKTPLTPASPVSPSNPAAPVDVTPA